MYPPRVHPCTHPAVHLMLPLTVTHAGKQALPPWEGCPHRLLTSSLTRLVVYVSRLVSAVPRLVSLTHPDIQPRVTPHKLGLRYNNETRPSQRRGRVSFPDGPDRRAVRRGGLVLASPPARPGPDQDQAEDLVRGQTSTRTRTRPRHSRGRGLVLTSTSSNSVSVRTSNRTRPRYDLGLVLLHITY